MLVWVVTVATASEAKLERVKESSQTKGAACGKPFDREVWPAAEDVEVTESEADFRLYVNQWIFQLWCFPDIWMASYYLAANMLPCKGSASKPGTQSGS